MSAVLCSFKGCKNWAKDNQGRCKSHPIAPEPRKVTAPVEVVEWADGWLALHQGVECSSTIKKADVKSVCEHNGGRVGLPTATVLGDMVARAGNLTILEIKGKYNETLSGIYFNIVQYTVKGSSASTRSLYKAAVTHKKGASVCYENSVLPLSSAASGHLLVNQSLAPCLLCRNGYSAWAKSGNRTIVVAFEKGYDNSKANGVFIFSSTGLCFEI